MCTVPTVHCSLFLPECGSLTVDVHMQRNYLQANSDTADDREHKIAFRFTLTQCWTINNRVKVILQAMYVHMMRGWGMDGRVLCTININEDR